MSGAGALPYLGVGLSYRWHLNADIVRAAAEIDWLELTPEHFLPFTDDARRRIELLARRFPIVGHSLELSVGSDGDEEPGYREGVARALDCASAVWHGDHLCFTRTGDLPVRALTPLPFTDAAVEVAVRNVRAIARTLGRPFLVENVAYYFENPLSTMSEVEFVRRVVEGADCGLLLDLHNVLVNATNLKRDPYTMLDALPLERVVQIHIAGGEEVAGLRVDSHSSMCPDDEWALLEHVVPRCPVRGVNFEMDARFPPFARIAEELGRARAILNRHGAGDA